MTSDKHVSYERQSSKETSNSLIYNHHMHAFINVK